MILFFNYVSIRVLGLDIPHSNVPVKLDANYTESEWFDANAISIRWKYGLGNFSASYESYYVEEYELFINLTIKHNGTHILAFFEIPDLTYNVIDWQDYPNNIPRDPFGYTTFYPNWDHFSLIFDRDGFSDAKAFFMPDYPLDLYINESSGYHSDLEIGGNNDIIGFSKWNEKSGYIVEMTFPISSDDENVNDLKLEIGDSTFLKFFYWDALSLGELYHFYSPCNTNFKILAPRNNTIQVYIGTHWKSESTQLSHEGVDIENAIVRSVNKPEGQPELYGVTNEYGIVKFFDVKFGNYTFEVEAEGYKKELFTTFYVRNPWYITKPMLVEVFIDREKSLEKYVQYIILGIVALFIMNFIRRAHKF